METLHQPVMLKEVLAVLEPQRGESYLDLTAGYAGHASRILDVTRNYKDAVLVDRDQFACKFLCGKYESEPVKIVNLDFYSAALQEIEYGNSFDMILADFGVSSPQLDMGERGFAFAKSGPLDMRMDQGQKLTAEQIVNKWSSRDLEEVLIKYGELSVGFARKVVRLLVQGRPWQDTEELATAIKTVARYSRIHPATRVFQALRIEVNDELKQIEQSLPLLLRLLKPGGRMAMITFHSLEDRIVKSFLRAESSLGEESQLELVNKKPLVAGEEELLINPRARSAKLRAARRH